MSGKGCGCYDFISLSLQTRQKKTHQLIWILKSNSLRRAAKEKTAEMKAVDELLEEKLLQLKIC